VPASSARPERPPAPTDRRRSPTGSVFETVSASAAGPLCDVGQREHHVALDAGAERRELDEQWARPARPEPRRRPARWASLSRSRPRTRSGSSR
jgi:hypothetical protein